MTDQPSSACCLVPSRHRPTDWWTVRQTLDPINCCPLLSPPHTNRLCMTRKWRDSDHHRLNALHRWISCHCSPTRIERFDLQQADILYDSIWQNISISVSVSIIETALTLSPTGWFKSHAFGVRLTIACNVTHSFLNTVYFLNVIIL